MNLEEERSRLVFFITDVYQWLEVSYDIDGEHHEEGSPWPPLSIYVSLRPLAKKAWAEFILEHPLEKTKLSIGELDERALIAHGLHGKQLEFKLSVIDLLANKYKNLRSPGRFRSKLVDAIDVPLDSLIGALGAGTALKELKDILRAQSH